MSYTAQPLEPVMIRCREEAHETRTEKKDIERRERPFVALRRLDFDTLLVRDGVRWDFVRTPEELARIAERVKKEIAPGEFMRFVAHLCATHGAGLVRAAGLPIGPVRVAS